MRHGGSAIERPRMAMAMAMECERERACAMEVQEPETLSWKLGLSVGA
jgi:hypothetical protein